MGAERGGDGTPIGDTPLVHDAIHRGDLPPGHPGHPGRPAAEEMLAEARERDDDHDKREGGIRP